MASTKRGRRGSNNFSGDEDIDMKPPAAGGGSPVKIDYEVYNEEFGECSSGK